MNRAKSRIRDEVIVEAWQSLDTNWLGSAELEAVQRLLEKEFGENATPSPASIARTLAEHGANLRHAEILSLDTSWRKRRLAELFSADELDFRSIETAFESMARLDDLQIHLNSEGDETGLARLQDLVLKLKNELRLVAKTRLPVGDVRQVAAEVVEWLTIWLQTPHIFPNWLELRKNSAEFRSKFGDRE